MTTNSPNPVDGDVQALIADCQAEIAEIEKALTTWGAAWIPSLQSKLNRQQVALAALTAEPIGFIHNFVNPDDSERPGGIFKEDNHHYGRPVYLTPPAQLLRPVELPHPFAWSPGGKKYYSEDQLKEVILKLGGEVKND